MIKILIVEDDLDLGDLLKQYLELNKFDVQRVFNGIEAREILKEQSFNILILDVMMPKEDGFTLAQKLQIKYPDLPFLFVTARKMKEDILTGLKLGADDYVVKPFEAEELILRIKNIMNRAEQQKTVRAELPQNEIISIGKYTFDATNLELKINSIEGKDLTPFLIKEVNILSKNKTLKANVELIINNALLAGKISKNFLVK